MSEEEIYDEETWEEAWKQGEKEGYNKAMKEVVEVLEKHHMQMLNHELNLSDKQISFYGVLLEAHTNSIAKDLGLKLFKSEKELEGKG